MDVYIATDHAGFPLKEILVPFITSLGHSVTDFGASSLDDQDDYPDYVGPLATEVSNKQGSMGIVLGGSGQGEAIAANRVKTVRAAVYYGGALEIVSLAREHNDANVLSLGARFVTEEEAKRAVEVFLSTSFSQDERHIRRIAKLDSHD